MDPGTLERLGYLAPARAHREVLGLSRRLSPGQISEVVRAAATTGEPDRVLLALGRIPQALARAPGAETLAARVVQASEAMGRLLVQRPGLLAWGCRSRSLAGPSSLAEQLDAARAAIAHLTGESPLLWRRLRRFKARAFFRLVARDVFLRAPVAEIGCEQAQLAEAMLRAALEALRAGFEARHGRMQPDGFCVLGLGKLGGEDLNFSSDVDLVYLYRGEGETAGGTSGVLSNVQFATRLGDALTRAMSTLTDDGFCFRVDLNLRPQGRGGPSVTSLPAALQYYEEHGRTWERAAWIKARPVAGDDALGTELLDSLTSFVWRRTLDLAAVEALRELKGQIDLRGRASTDDVKLGPGGIREVEFFANALQLLLGGRDPSLRVRSTVRALGRLADSGQIAQPEADALAEAYGFLRRVENRLQMVDERQTHALPEEAAERTRVAASLGFRSLADFDAELERHRHFVHRAFETLLGQTARGELPEEPLIALALDADSPAEARRAALERRGFLDPDRALASVQRLRRVLAAARVLEGPGPGLTGIRLVTECVRTPDPDQALFFLVEFLSALAAPLGSLRLLQQRPAATRRLVNLFGQSAFLSAYFVRNPELLDALVQLDAAEFHQLPERLADQVRARVTRVENGEERLSTMRRVKNEEVLRIALGDIASELSVPEVAEQLTAVADALLDDTLFLAEAEARERFGEPRLEGGVARLAVLALGKLGGRELGYQSDLDLLFVYSGVATAETSGGTRGLVTQHEYFARVVQRLLALLHMQLREGRLYEVDTRLRPSGNQGTLVVSEEAFLEHHTRRGQLWERQALIKARPVAGDLVLGARLVEEVVHPLVYLRPLPEDGAAEIHRIRTRMEREIAGESAGRLNPKTGHGGLVDVEFATQWLQLLHGRAHPEVRSTNTLAALDALERSGRLPSGDGRVLREGYLFHRRVELRQRLVHGRPLAHLHTSGPSLSLLARRLGIGGADPGAAFLAEYGRQAEAVRSAYARILGVC